MSEWEREALALLLYLRFLDDIFGIWMHNIEHFSKFINILNNHHPPIKVKYTIDPVQINFLDATVFFQPSNTSHTKLLTKVFFKAAYIRALLHKSSYHPKHTFKGIKSQIIRFHRLSSSSDFSNSVSILFTALQSRKYSKRFLRSLKNQTLASLAPFAHWTVRLHPGSMARGAPIYRFSYLPHPVLTSYPQPHSLS